MGCVCPNFIKEEIKMKRFLSAILCFVMLLGMLPAIGLPVFGQTVMVPTTIADSYTGAGYVWYNGTGYTSTDGMYVEIVEDGADDVGAMHIYQADGVVASEDMRVYISIADVPAGTYTLQYNIKGSDLGITTTNDACRFYLNNDSGATTQFRILAGTKSLTNWTKLSETVTTSNASGLLILGISKYVCGIDCYVDNIKLLDSNGNDLLKNAGSFCQEKEQTTQSSVATIAPSNPDTNYVWFNHNGYVNNDTKVLEIVETGADDAGSVHIFQPDGQTADADMMVGIRVDCVPTGTYTLSYKIKGKDLGNTDNNYNKFYLYGNGDLTNQFRVAAGTKTLNDWTEVSETFTTASDVYYIYLQVSKYVNGADFYVDNVKLTDASGKDYLAGAGNFCVIAEEEPEATEPETTEPPEPGTTVPATVYGEDPQDLYKWYNYNGYTATKDMYIEIVEDGADDVGSLHVYQTDGVTGTEDMRLKINTVNIPEGTYTLKMKVKGSDLGNTDTVNACRFYITSNADQFSQIRNLAGTKTLSDWTELTEVVDTTAGTNSVSLSISKYVNGADFYVDNVQIVDEQGNDILMGAGNFCTVVGDGIEGLPSEGLFTIDTDKMCGAYAAPKYVWTQMYPAGTPDNNTWPAWDDTHYGKIAPAGYRDRGSLYLKSASYKNVGVSIGLDMTVGETYTLGLWAKGVSNSGKVLSQYANGNIIIIGGSTALNTEWTYYECKFIAEIPQLNIMASDWGVTSIYIDNITLTDSTGKDVMKGYGDFCTAEYAMEDPKYLLSFEGVEEDGLKNYVGQVSVPGASDPTLSLNAEESEDGTALQATWSYNGEDPAYLHRYAGTADTWAGEFAKMASGYRYLRMWVSNPSHIPVNITVLATAENTVNYFDASAIKLIRKDGIQAYGEVDNASGYGEASSISVPKQFTGWLSIPLKNSLVAAEGYTDVIADYANVTGLQIEICKVPTTGEGDSSEYYYVIDDVCLSFEITGKQESTDDNNEYANYDTSVKGEGQVQNIIFLIGDGMGYGALDVARQERPVLYMDTIAAKGGMTGSVATTNLYGDVTDSAAAGTALATGYLTKNTVLGLTENLEPVMNLGEYMKQLGKKLGLVTTTTMVDATPAAFAAHTNIRGNFTAVAKDILALGVDVVQGGGRSYLSETVQDATGKTLTLTEYAQSLGYTYATTTAQMEAVISGKLWGIYQDENMPWVSDNITSVPSLPEMTAKTLALLENENGFFAMIEGGKIDLAGHSNSAVDTRLETLAFDDAVKIAMDYADAHPGTLVIITADHETGGVRVGQDGSISYYTTSHTDELVPYYAYGTGAEYFADLTVNTQLNYAIRRATIGDVSVGATSVPTDAQLMDSQDVDVSEEKGVITYVAKEKSADITLTDADAGYAIIKYKTEAKHLVGMLDDAMINYAGDGKWHISDILVLDSGAEHSFQPLAYQKNDGYNSIELSGMSVQIDYVAFFETYEQAAAFQAHTALTGATPTALNGLSMSLGDDLDMNFYVAADETNLENTTVSLTVGGKSIVSKLGQPDEFTGNYKFSVDLAAAQMTDTVTFQLAIGDTVIETGSYSVREYADTILAGSYDEDTKQLVCQMLHYGAAAQTYFGYNTQHLANTGVVQTGEQEIPAQIEQSMSVNDSVQELDFYGASLVFRSKIAVRFYLSGDVSGCSFTANGLPVSAVEKDGKYCIEIAEILPQDLDEQIELAATDANGNTLIVVYSPMDYILRMNRKGIENLKALLKALYNYHLAAESYLES